MKVKVKIKMEKELARLKKAMDAGYLDMTADEMKQEGRLLVSNPGRTPGLVQITPPFSQGVRTVAAKKQGETAVSYDINRVYGSPQTLFAKIQAKSPGAAKGFWAAVVQSDWTLANEIASRMTGYRLREFDDGAEHDNRRNRKGRVNGRQPTYFVAQKSSGAKNKSAPWIRKYLEEKKELVGMLGAEIIREAGFELGVLKGVPAWIKRHASKGMGRVTFKREKTGYSVTVENRSRRQQADLDRRYRAVLGYRENAMIYRLGKIARYMEKKLAAQLKD